MLIDVCTKSIAKRHIKINTTKCNITTKKITAMNQ